MTAETSSWLQKINIQVNIKQREKNMKEKGNSCVSGVFKYDNIAGMARSRVFVLCCVCSSLAHSWEQSNPRHASPGTLLTTSPPRHAMLSPSSLLLRLVFITLRQHQLGGGNDLILDGIIVIMEVSSGYTQH